MNPWIWFRYLFLASLLFFIVSLTANSQGLQKSDAEKFQIEIGSIFSSEGELPFWLHSNRWGTIERNSTNAYLRFSGNTDLGSIGAANFEVGTELVGRLSENKALFFNEGYLQVDWHLFKLVVGRKKHTLGIVDNSLSTGSMIQSGNSTPIPKIRISIPEYTSVPGTDRWLSFKGYFAHGWFENDRVVSGAYLHQKNIYLRLFRSESWFNLFAGFTHNVTWAGEHPALGRLPSSFKDFTRVILAKNIDEDDEDFPSNERGGTLGNTVAGYDTAVQMDFSFGTIKLNRLFYLEDRPGLVFRSPWDGIWGLSVDLDNSDDALVTKFNWEHLNTTRQGSKSFERRGADNYYSNGIYNSGWTYFDRTIGSPFLFTNDQTIGVKNNIVVMHSLGAQGFLNKNIRYKLMVSYSRNYGTKHIFVDDLLNTKSGRFSRRDQYSILLSTATKVMDNWWLGFDIAYDTGELYPNQIGIDASFTYQF